MSIGHQYNSCLRSVTTDRFRHQTRLHGKQGVHQWLRWSIAAMAALLSLSVSAGRAADRSITIGSGIAPAGGTVIVPIRAMDSVSNLAGLDLSIRVEVPPGTPQPGFSFTNGVDTRSWYSFSPPLQPARFVVFSGMGVPGPAEVMELNLGVDPATAAGSIITISAASAVISDDGGLEQAGSDLVTAGTVTVVVPGDLNGDGLVDARDLKLELELFLGLRAPTTTELAAGDVRPKPGRGGLAFGDGVIGADDLNWIFRRFLGLESAP